MLLKHLLHVTLQYKLEWESKKNKYKYIYEYFIEKICLKEESLHVGKEYVNRRNFNKEQVTSQLQMINRNTGIQLMQGENLYLEEQVYVEL